MYHIKATFGLAADAETAPENNKEQNGAEHDENICCVA